MLFNRISHRYDRWYATPRGRIIDAAQKELIFDLARVLPGEKILDLGCGTGNYSLEMARRGSLVTGADISDGMLSEAKRKAEALGLSIDWVQADCTDLPFASGTFDAVVTVTALEFVNDPRGALLEGMRVLKPGGRIVAGVLTRNSAWGRHYQEEGERNPDSVFASARLFTKPELTGLLPCCCGIRAGSFISPGPPELNPVEASSLEEMIDTRYPKGAQPPTEPDFLTARWEKPDVDGPRLACQLALYPLGTDAIGHAVKKALRVLACYPVSFDIGGMSTVVTGTAAAVWTAVWALADRAAENGLEVVINASFSNRCGCK